MLNKIVGGVESFPAIDSHQANFPIHSDPFCEFIWGLKYRREDEVAMINTIERVCADVLGYDHPSHPHVFKLMHQSITLPGGRILAGSGLPHHHSTLMNCYVMGEIDDSLEGIMSCLRES